jgi:hypothetical protein
MLKHTLNSEKWKFHADLTIHSDSQLNDKMQLMPNSKNKLDNFSFVFRYQVTILGFFL